MISPISSGSAAVLTLFSIAWILTSLIMALNLHVLIRENQQMMTELARQLALAHPLKPLDQINDRVIPGTAIEYKADDSGRLRNRERKFEPGRIPGGITPLLLFLLLLNAAALAAGQLLFKSTAIRVMGLPFVAMVSKLALVPLFYAACLLYAAATVVWVWILARLPLSTAYPFVGLSFVMVSLAGWFFLGEPA